MFSEARNKSWSLMNTGLEFTSVPFKPPSPPFNVDAGLIECHHEFHTTLIRGKGENKQYNGECLKCTQ